MPSDKPSEMPSPSFRLPVGEPGATAALDEQTWADLDMAAVCAHIDRCVSTPGWLVFRRMLCTPTMSPDTVAARNELIAALAPGSPAVQGLRAPIERLGRVAGAEDLARLLWEKPPSPLPHAWLHPVLALLAALSVPLALALGGPWVFAPVGAFAVNAAVHSRRRVQWQWEIQALLFVGALRACARRVIGHPVQAIEEQQSRLRRALAQSNPVTRRLTLLSAGGVKDLLYEYLNAFLLLELRAYQATVRRWREATPSLRDLFLTIGELDALAAVARWRSELPVWCPPEWDAGAPRIQIDEGVHPLIADPVPNSLTLAGRGCLVTGANMSGKSTLLRIVGINAILAQSIATCTARRYQATPLRVISSMRVGDALVEGKSRYLAEAERLLALVRQADSGTPTLCLVDELLSGTNASERLAASQAILSHLVQRGTLVLAATHDLELTEHLAGRYDSCFFADDFARDDLRFDHRLRQGVATTRNAIRLLERLGYPEEIVRQARASQTT